MSSNTAQLIEGSMKVMPRRGAPGAPRFGAEIIGVDLRTIDDTAFADIHRAWIEHQVLLFRAQSLNDQDLIAFSRRFGDLDHAPIQENGQR
ncbi:MAG: TauD/TfdA family dioxygenase, partial [Acetobacteraceae bacterium]